MTAWSSLVFQQNLLKVLQNLRKLIRQYNASTGPDAMPSYSFLGGRTAAAGGLSPLPGLGRLTLGALHLPALCTVGNLPPASHLRQLRLVPFAALPICCAVAATATCAECEPAATESPHSASDNDISVLDTAIWTIPILKALAELRSTYQELVRDPMWELAMNGMSSGGRNAVLGQYMDLDEALYEFAAMEAEEDVMCCGNGQSARNVPAPEDPFAALLEFATLGLECDAEGCRLPV